jgi:phosphoribosylformylglycinamidine cyclo-ligase
VLLGLPSAGLHTNGYSLARRVLFERAGFKPQDFVPALGTTIGDALLAQHRSYLGPMLPLLDAGLVKGMAHITGGGITDNLPRILPEDCDAAIDSGAWDTPPIFALLQSQGEIGTAEMFRTFNMGIGLIVVTAADDVDEAHRLIARAGPDALRVGEVVAGHRSVRYRHLS